MLTLGMMANNIGVDLAILCETLAEICETQKSKIKSIDLNTNTVTLTNGYIINANKLF